MLSWAFFMSTSLENHRIVGVDGDGTCDALHRAAQGPRLDRIGVAIIRRGIELVLGQGCPNDDILVLRQLGLAADATVGITRPALHVREEVDRGWNWRAARPIVRPRDQGDRIGAGWVQDSAL